MTRKAWINQIDDEQAQVIATTLFYDPKGHEMAQKALKSKKPEDKQSFRNFVRMYLRKLGITHKQFIVKKTKQLISTVNQ